MHLAIPYSSRKAPSRKAPSRNLQETIVSCQILAVQNDLYSMNESENKNRLTLSPANAKLWAAITGPALNDQTTPINCLRILREIESGMTPVIFQEFKNLSVSQTLAESRATIHSRLDKCDDCAEFVASVRDMINEEIDAAASDYAKL